MTAAAAGLGWLVYGLANAPVPRCRVRRGSIFRFGIGDDRRGEEPRGDRPIDRSTGRPGDRALGMHARVCGDPPVSIVMAPFEVDRLGWPDPSMQTGRLDHGRVASGEDEPITIPAAPVPVSA